MTDTDCLKIICLNTWGGRAGLEAFLSFFAQYQETDVFCLQEVWNGGEHMVGKIAAGRKMDGVEPRLFQKIQAILPQHRGYFRPHLYDFFGLAIFAKANLEVVDEGEYFVHQEKGYVPETDIAYHARNLHYITVKTPSGLKTIINFHGLWSEQGKGDTEARFVQAKKIVDFTNQFSHPLILAGDFNLVPSTKSIKILEEAGFENLVHRYGLSSTRTSLYHKAERFADYVFIKDAVTVHEFRTLPEEVSDHTALFVDCS